MGAKHTKGPWRVVAKKHWSASIPVMADQKKSGIPVGWSSRVAHGGDEEALANANLIAAAPDLLEALKTTLSNLRSLKENAFRGVKTYDVWERVVADAIAKAEGKS